MRRLYPICLSLSCLYLAAGCSEPPKPKAEEKSTEAEDEDEGKTKKSESAGSLGPIPTDGVAVVNGKPITTEVFRKIYDLKLQKYQDRDREIPTTADRRYRKSITERLIYQEVLRQESKELGIEHDKAALAKREEAQKKGIKDWERHLRRRGESEDSLREMYIAELRERAILDKHGKLLITGGDVDAEYDKIKPNYKKDKERVRAAHILVRIGPKDRPPASADKDKPSDEDSAKWEKEALATAKEIHKKALVEGTDFAELAKELSDGPSARKGGDLGIFTKDRMVGEFSKAAFALKSGEISKPIKTKFGFHIIKSFGKYGPGDLPKEALEGQIRERLEARKLHQGRRDLKAELLEKFKVDNTMEKILGPDPRKSARKKGHKPGQKPRKGFGTSAGSSKVQADAKGGGHGHAHGKTPGAEAEGDADTKAKKADAKKADAKKADAKKADAKKPDAKKVDAKKPDAKKVDAKKVDAKKVDAKKVDAKKVDAKKVDAKKVDAKKPDAKKPEKADAKPAAAQ